jgi:plastocyanin
MKTRLSLTIAALFLLAACGAQPAAPPAATPAGSLPPVAGAPTAAPLSGQVNVIMSGFAFDPPELTIKAGTTVTWTNQDSATHNVKADDDSWVSPDLGKGDSYSHTFDTAGVVAYRCVFHSNMIATITVVP